MSTTVRNARIFCRRRHREELLAIPLVTFCSLLTVELVPLQYCQVGSMKKLEQSFVVDLPIVESVCRLRQNFLSAELLKHLMLSFICAIVKQSGRHNVIFLGE